MRQDQTILGNVLKYALIAMFIVVDDEVEVVTWLLCRANMDERLWHFCCNV